MGIAVKINFHTVLGMENKNMHHFGALSVEYAFCMILAAIFLEGVLALFTDMSTDILGEFMEWISSPYP